jgi:hypothetical protein
MKSERADALDWLRVPTTLAVFLFHSGAAFAAGDWQLNAPTKSFAITIWNGHHSARLLGTTIANPNCVAV